MPQMMPMLWVLLLMYMFMLLFLTAIYLYTIISPINSKKLFNSTSNWIWKW